MFLTGNQERYLLAEKSSDASFFVTIWFEIKGALDVARLRAAIHSVVARHPALRTGFLPDAHSIFRPVIHEEAHFPFDEIAINSLSDEDIRIACAPFLGKVADIANPAALQHYTVLHANGRAAIVFSQHHSITDGKSLDLFVAEVAAAYNGAPITGPAPMAIPDAAPPPDADADYFRSLLGNLAEVPRLHRNRRGPRQMLAAAAEIGTMETARLHELAQQSSPFSILAAVFAIEIGTLTGLDDIVFSIQSAGRKHYHNTEALGVFSNALPIRVKLDPQQSFAVLASRIKVLVREAIAHENLPYHRIQQESGVAADFAINLYPASPGLPLGGLEVGPRHFLPSDSDYAINLRWERRGSGDSCHYAGEAYFNAGAIEENRVAAFNRRYEVTLATALANPDHSITQIAASGREAAMPFVAAIPAPRRIFELVREAAQQASPSAAILHDGKTTSYAALIEATEEAAARMAAAGVRSGQTIAILAERSAAFIVALLAVSRLGATFAVLDAEYPDARLNENLKSLAVDHLLAATESLDTRLAEIAPPGVAPLLWRSAPATVPAPQPAVPDAEDIAYYLFTSGTTGKPKAVGIGHTALPAFLRWERQFLGVSGNDRVSLLSGLAHDPVLRDIFLPLTSGATLAIPAPAAIRDPRRLRQWLSDTGITIIHTTPPMGKLLAEISAGQPVFPALRAICWGGDLLPQTLVNQFSAANPQLRQVNYYGATETPQAVAFYSVEPSPDRILAPIGQALPHTRLTIIGHDGLPLPTGAVGEILVDTPYHVRLAGQTAGPGGQHYRTGDLGYRLPDGTIQLIGRDDDQVKIRGYRVELADVERHIRALPEVVDALVLKDEAPGGDAILLAHVRLHPGSAEAENAGQKLLRRLAHQLPAYMVPAQVYVHVAFPLLPNGKVDRAALRRMQPAARQAPAAADRQDKTRWSKNECAIAQIFEEITGRPVPSVDASFSELGADSLNSIQVLLRLETLLTEVPDDWFEQSIKSLAQRQQRQAATSAREQLAAQLRPIRIEPAIPLRAFAILAIIAFHFGLGSVGSGMTFLLIYLSGISFIRFQIDPVLHRQYTALVNNIIKVALIALPICLMYGIYNYIYGARDWYLIMLMFTNFVDYSQNSHIQGSIYLWFIGCYLQIYIFILMLVLQPRILQVIKKNIFRFFLAMFLLSAFSGFAGPFFFRPEGLENIGPGSIWKLLPNLHLATFALGAIIEISRKDRRKLTLASVLGMLYCLTCSRYFGYEFGIIVAGVLVTAWIPSVRLPHVFARLAGVISQASLILYLLHIPLYSVARKTGFGSEDYRLIVFLVIIVSATIFALHFDKLYDWMQARIRPARTVRVTE